MITGKSNFQWTNRILAKAASDNLTAFVVPGAEVARARQLNLENAGLTATNVPRHANVLLLVGEVPVGLRQYAFNLYNQMPNPKSILAVGTNAFDPLPVPDATADFGGQNIKPAVEKLRELLADKTFMNRTNNLSNNDHFQANRHSMREMEQGEHEGMENMGFMSMVAMTENLPKSPDGLPMEWAEARFGPLFAGLPAGLELTFLLDGDNIAQTEVSTESVKRGLQRGWLGTAKHFLETFSQIDPSTAPTYRILASMALENTLGKTPDESTKRARGVVLAKDRVTSHLNWLASFATLIHLPAFMTTAEHCLANTQTAKTNRDFQVLRQDCGKLTSQIKTNWLLKKRLAGVGRTDDGTDAWTRLVLRITETEESLSFLAKSKPSVGINVEDAEVTANTLGKGEATLKTPRGNASLSVSAQNGRISKVSFSPPSVKKIELLPGLVQNMEIADALVTVASLDISPWEVAL